MDLDGRNGFKLHRMKQQHHRLARTPIREAYCSEATYNRAIEAAKRAMQ